MDCIFRWRSVPVLGFFWLVFGLFFSTLYALDSDKTVMIGAGLSQGIRSQTPIHVPACGNPRETLASYNSLLLAIKEVFESGSYYGDVDWKQEQQIIDLYSKLAYLLDTSKLPEKSRYAQVNIISSQLSEILDRIDVPDGDTIPDDLSENVLYWRIPGTVITLARIAEGPRKGDWVFSDDTVAQADHLYAQVRGLPYREDATVGMIKDQGGLLDHYIAYTGSLIPVVFTNHIPSVLRTTFLGDPLWKHLATLAILGTLVLLGWLVHRLTRYRKDRLDSPNHIGMQVRRIILPLVMLVLIHVAIDLITVDVRLRLLPLEVTDDLLWIGFYLTAFWLCVCIANFISAIIIAMPSISPFGLDASLVRLGCRLVAYLVGLWLLIAGMQQLGLSLLPLIAGVSVGGLAFALAARPTLGNILGGILIFADRPFKVGERVVINEHDGVVEEIGLRSTRIRNLDGHLLTVPNEEVSSSYVVNIGQRRHIKRVLNVTLTYDTPPGKIQEAITIIKQLLSLEEDGDKSSGELDRPSNSRINTPGFMPRVFFNDLNADSLNLLVVYWYAPPDYYEYLEHATWFNIQLVKRFNDAGIQFAFPTQTIEVKSSEPLPLAKVNL